MLDLLEILNVLKPVPTKDKVLSKFSKDIKTVRVPNNVEATPENTTVDAITQSISTS
jgi:hypothetical protein